MKIKYFLMSVLLLAGAQAFAQDEVETLLFPADQAPTDGMVIEGTNVKFTLGADGKWPAKVTSAVSAGSANANFKQDYTDSKGAAKNGIAYVSGGNNPKDGALEEKEDGTITSTGSNYSPANKNVPASGTYYIIEAQKAGSIRACVVLNANKSFFVTKGDGTMLDGENGEFTITDGNGEAVTFGTVVDEANNKEYPYSVATKLNGGMVCFDVEAGEQYYIFCTGSKLGFAGVEFTPKSSGTEPVGEVRGDLNGDGVVTITDVLILVNILVGQE